MQVALIHSHLNGRGGSQRYVLEIARCLKDLGLVVDIFAYQLNQKTCYPELTQNLSIYSVHQIETDSKNQNNSTLKNEGPLLRFLKKVYRIPFIRKIFISFGFDYIASSILSSKNSTKLSQLIAKTQKKYDLIFAHEEPLSVMAAIHFKKKFLPQIFIYWFCYDTIEKWFLEWKEEHKKSWLRSFVLRKFLFRWDRNQIRKYIDKSAVLDRAMANRFARLYGKVPLIRRGGIPEYVFDYPRSSFLQEKIQAKADGKIIVFCLTRFTRYKRVHDIFELYRALTPDQRDQFFFYINAPITESDYFSWCESEYNDVFSSSNFIINTDFPKNDQEMYQMYLSSDVFLFPNQNQTWGHAPLEAMACGNYVICSNGSGIHEVIQDICPSVYPVSDIEKMKQLLMDCLDQNTLNQRATKQKMYARNHLTWLKVCQQYLRDFQSMTKVTESK